MPVRRRHEDLARTIAFIGGIDTRHDISVEVFTLEPRWARAEKESAQNAGR